MYCRANKRICLFVFWKNCCLEENITTLYCQDPVDPRNFYGNLARLLCFTTRWKKKYIFPGHVLLWISRTENWGHTSKQWLFAFPLSVFTVIIGPICILNYDNTSCRVSNLGTYPKDLLPKLYFVIKIDLVIEKTFKIRGWRPRIFNWGYIKEGIHQFLWLKEGIHQFLW